MKFLLMLVVLGVFSACGLEEKESQYKFAIRKKVDDTVVNHYAKYRFVFEGYEDADVAIKVAVQSGQAKTLWVRDLISTDNPLEEVKLMTSANQFSFRGTSAGELGGAYTGRLETSADGEITGCCDAMTFVPTADNTLWFSGTKLETLTAAQWEQLNENSVENTIENSVEHSPPPATPTLMVTELGTQHVGVLFDITGALNVRRLEAHNRDGKVEGALARWRTSVGARIFAVEGTDGLFLTDAALEAGVTELIGFDEHDNKVLKANVTVAARDDTIVVTASLYGSGSYTWIAFSANPNPDPLEDFRMRNVEQNIYLSFNADMQVHDHDTGGPNALGRDSRGIWVGMYGFECLVGGRVMARVLNTVYTGTCLAEGS